MREYLFDAKNLGHSPKYIVFNMLIDDQPYVGQVWTTKLNSNAPFGPPKYFKVDCYPSIGTFLSGTMPTEIEMVDPSKIKILDIIDTASKKDPTILSAILDVSDQIIRVDTSFAIYAIQEKLEPLLHTLHEYLEEYGLEHPKSNYKDLLIYIREQITSVENLGNVGQDEVAKREHMRQMIAMLKDGLKKWMYGLLYRGELN